MSATPDPVTPLAATPSQLPRRSPYQPHLNYRKLSLEYWEVTRYGSTIDQDAGHVSTSKSDMGASLLKSSSILDKGGSVVGYAIDVYEFLMSPEDDPVQKALEVVINDLKTVMLKQDLDQLDAIINNKVTPVAAKIDAATDAMKAFNDSDPS